MDVVDEKRTPLLDESVEEEETYFHDSFNVINHEYGRSWVVYSTSRHYDVEWRKTMLDEMSRDKAKQEGEACRRFQSRVDVEMVVVDILVEWTQESARKRK